MKKTYTIRLLFKKGNPHPPVPTALRISDEALPAMVDMAVRMLRRGELKEFGVGGGR